MSTTIVNPQGEGNSAGLIVGLVLAAVILAVAFYFGLPYFRSQMNQPQQPSTINVTVPSPLPAPAPAPTPAPAE